MPKDDGKPGESLQETATSELRQTHKDLMFRMKDSPENPTLERRHKAIVAELKRRGEDVMKKNEGLEGLADFLSKGGPYYGPQGGKYADPQHKVAWDDKVHGKGGGAAAEGPKLETASQLLGMGIKNQDTAAVDKAVSALKEIAKQKGMKAKATAELRSQLKSARVEAKTMVGRAEADRRRAKPVAGREAYSHEHVMKARDIRDTIDEARAEIAASGKSEATKQKQAASAKKHEDLSKLASEAHATLKNKDATDSERDKMRSNLRVLVGREEHKPASEAKPEAKPEAKEPEQLSLPGMAKSEGTMSGLESLSDFLEKAEGMPSHEPKLGAGKGSTCGATADGGEVAAKGKLGGSNTAPHYVNKASPDGKEKLSDDDVEDEKQMKPHTKPIERMKKSDEDEAPHERLSGEHAHAEAVARERLVKGQPDVQWSPYAARMGADADVQQLLKSGFGEPSLSPAKAPIHQGVLCKSCETPHTAALTACPNCGNGTTAYRSLPGALTSGHPQVEATRMPLLRQARRVADIKIGG